METVELLQQIVFLIISAAFAFGLIAIMLIFLYYEIQDIRLTQKYIKTIESSQNEEYNETDQ